MSFQMLQSLEGNLNANSCLRKINKMEINKHVSDYKIIDYTIFSKTPRKTES